MSENGYLYTIPVQVRLATPLADAEDGRLLCVSMEEIVEEGLAASGVSVSEVICLHPRAGVLRHMTTNAE